MQHVTHFQHTSHTPHTPELLTASAARLHPFSPKPMDTRFATSSASGCGYRNGYENGSRYRKRQNPRQNQQRSWHLSRPCSTDAGSTPLELPWRQHTPGNRPNCTGQANHQQCRFAAAELEQCRTDIKGGAPPLAVQPRGQPLKPLNLHQPLAPPLAVAARLSNKECRHLTAI